ncbi:hypothetical protein COV20_04990 [Candidatus Woesearchaeota archaeon CG10_big_fil_rev_8_21_14_0_10_45_16]|nr:MAG: hypothetical protein COV20_04990 [Candidatus Woesearchaeota archaeon CG10_big_fil_rev_8_21_14_0_10_45_16]
MVKAIIFDFWGTLVENGVWSPIKQVRKILNIEVPFSEYVVRMERAMMAGKNKTLREAFEKVCNEFRIKADEQKIQDLIGMWNKSWMLARPYEEVESVLNGLNQKYTLILVSNTDPFSIDNVLEKFKLRDYFSHIFLSYNLGLLKTDEEFLRTALAKADLRPEDCILVGDSLQSDMLAAQNAGIKAILIDRKDRQDFKSKILNLRELENEL